MLPESHYQSYQAFKQILEQLYEAIESADFEITAVNTTLTQVQERFRSQLLRLGVDTLDPVLASQIQSLQTEIHKQLKLLNLDMTFLRGAKQASTQQQRQEQMRDRVKTLIRYCDSILQEPEANLYKE